MRIEDFVVLAIIFIFVRIAFKRNNSSFTEYCDAPKAGAAMKLLATNGYHVVTGKHRVPIDVETAERKYQSRIMIDFVVKKNDATYAVKIKNKRKMDRISGSFLREELLKYQLFFRVDGVLYIDIEKDKIHEVSFNYPSVQYKKSFLDYLSFPKWLLIIAFIGIFIFFLR